jgi:hypothetical protein
MCYGNHNENTEDNNNSAGRMIKTIITNLMVRRRRRRGGCGGLSLKKINTFCFVMVHTEIKLLTNKQTL